MDVKPSMLLFSKVNTDAVPLLGSILGLSLVLWPKQMSNLRFRSLVFVSISSRPHNTSPRQIDREEGSRSQPARPPVACRRYGRRGGVREGRRGEPRHARRLPVLAEGAAHAGGEEGPVRGEARRPRQQARMVSEHQPRG